MAFPYWLPAPAAAAFGLVVGSFLNVVVARLPSGQSVVRPRSRCPKCGEAISWHDNIPVLSFCLLRGKCRKCSAPISPRYVVIELITGLLFLASLLRFGPSPLLFARDWPLLALLVAVTFIDLEHRLIPDALSLGGLILALATCWLDPGLGFLWAGIGAAMGFGTFYGLAWAYERFTGKMGLGGGDIKLLAMIGAFLGPGGVFATILISSVTGSVLGIAWALAGDRKQVLGFSIPYGPFLVLGALYYYLLGDVLWFQFTIPT